MTNEKYLGEEILGMLIFKFSIPCVLSLLISALYNIVDQIFIGNSSEGALGNTATTIVFPLTCIALAFGLMIGDGAAAYMSLCLGKGEKEKTEQDGRHKPSFLFGDFTDLLCHLFSASFFDSFIFWSKDRGVFEESL